MVLRVARQLTAGPWSAQQTNKGRLSRNSTPTQDSSRKHVQRALRMVASELKGWC